MVLGKIILLRILNWAYSISYFPNLNFSFFSFPHFCLLFHCMYFSGLPVYFIEPHHPAKYFWRNTFYGETDDFRRFTYFCRAALEFLGRTGKNPDIIHCHDWQTALVVNSPCPPSKRFPDLVFPFKTLFQKLPISSRFLQPSPFFTLILSSFSSSTFRLLSIGRFTTQVELCLQPMLFSPVIILSTRGQKGQMPWLPLAYMYRKCTARTECRTTSSWIESIFSK